MNEPAETAGAVALANVVVVVLAYLSPTSRVTHPVNGHALTSKTRRQRLRTVACILWASDIVEVSQAPSRSVRSSCSPLHHVRVGAKYVGTEGFVTVKNVFPLVRRMR